ncbi:MAG: alanine racemase [Candidatus Zixiibacteriota bacterium]|nr:MAG: alanine racemase [candidate division Zixibacteria bacterium]
MALRHPLQWLELSRSAFRKNIRALSRLAGPKRVMAVSVKANAYGHGLPEIIGFLEAQKEVSYITVHALEEAARSRASGWSGSIMLIGPLPTDQVEAVAALDIEPVIFTRETLRAVGRLSDKLNRRIRTHLKLETGTGRQGITAEELPSFAALYKKYPNLGKPYGAAMHFANIEDTTRHDYAELQLKRFHELLRQMTALGIKPTIRHTASSAAMILFDKTRFELVRPGLSAYGHWSSKETYLSYRLEGGSNDLFCPVLSWRARITQLKKLPANAFIGYGCTYRTTAPARIAVLPVGYADGYPRALSNRGHVLIRGRRAPIRGRICMNLLMVDVSDIKGVRLGDTATLIGRDGDEEVTAEMLADWGGTINYEILARLSPLLPRQVLS